MADEATRAAPARAHDAGGRTEAPQAPVEHAPRAGLALVQMVPDGPEAAPRVAQLFALYRAEQPDIAAWIHAHRGAAFWRQVQAALPDERRPTAPGSDSPIAAAILAMKDDSAPEVEAVARAYATSDLPPNSASEQIIELRGGPFLLRVLDVVQRADEVRDHAFDTSPVTVTRSVTASSGVVLPPGRRLRRVGLANHGPGPDWICVVDLDDPQQPTLLVDSIGIPPFVPFVTPPPRWEPAAPHDTGAAASAAERRVGEIGHFVRAVTARAADGTAIEVGRRQLRIEQLVRTAQGTAVLLARDDAGAELWLDPDRLPALEPGVGDEAPYREFHAPLWTAAGPRPEDAQQGTMLNCGLIATMQSIAAGIPEAIRARITPHAPGQSRYTVSLFERTHVDGGQPFFTLHSFEVDTMLPASSGGSSLGADAERVLWPALLEKAFVFYDKLVEEPDSNRGPNYHFLTAYNAETAMMALTGEAAISTQFTAERSPQLIDDIRRNLAADRPVIVSTDSGVSQKYGIAAHHVYSVASIQGDTVSLRNPWGESASRREVPIDVFVALFEVLHLLEGPATSSRDLEYEEWDKARDPNLHEAERRQDARDRRVDPWMEHGGGARTETDLGVAAAGYDDTLWVRMGGGGVSNTIAYSPETANLQTSVAYQHGLSPGTELAFAAAMNADLAEPSVGAGVGVALHAGSFAAQATGTFGGGGYGGELRMGAAASDRLYAYGGLAFEHGKGEPTTARGDLGVDYTGDRLALASALRGEQQIGGVGTVGVDTAAIASIVDGRLYGRVLAGAELRSDDAPHYHVGAGLTLTRAEGQALTAIGVMDERGGIDLRLQLDIFRGRIANAGELADETKRGLISLIAGYRNQTRTDVLDDSLGAPDAGLERGADGGSQTYLGVRFRF